ncbi:fibrinogen alpha chain-like [Patiria miniata]|uniref:Fibrinogen C-terminal domain-containing protein n=1 Tax=Patiria miniata TaxID=46514 RepID=A0A914B7L6_PATMI|nr:fibrinogen alpha chain-like [Patiria miniata]
MFVSDEKVFVVELLWCASLVLLARGDIRLRSAGFSGPAPATPDVVLRNHLLRTVHGVRSTGRCLATCLRSPLCLAVNYEEGGGTCELCAGKKEEFPEDVVLEAGWNYYEMESAVADSLPTTVKMVTTETPTTEGPTTEGPTTKGPTAEGLTTKGPTTEGPTTKGPITEGPTTEGPTTKGPTTEGPTTKGPTTEEPTTKGSTTEEPTTKVSTTEVPTTAHITTDKPPVDCWDIHTTSPSSPSGEYAIYPPAWANAMTVYCDMTTDLGGWTVFQRRGDSSQDFYLDWNSYKIGFGALTGSFWLGNDALNVLTATQGDYQLRIELESYGSVATFAKYGFVSVANEADTYRLNVTRYYGSYTTGDSMSYHSGQAFTTRDADNDNDVSRQCAQALQSAWWFNACCQSNLNGPYQSSASVPGLGVGITWGSWLGQDDSLKFTEMKIRPMSAQPVPKDCWDIYESGSLTTGVYTIHVTGRSQGLNVLCDMDFDGGGWTTLQKRVIGDLNFYRGWADYKAGFGTVDTVSDFWLGLDDIYLLTNQDAYQIRIVAVSWQDVLGYARYSEFRISDEADNYRLTISGYHGNAGDSLTGTHNGMPWSTLDRDNDNDARHCAEAMQGAWWYNNCQTSNLNGPYVTSPGYLSTNGQGIIWSSWLGQDDSMAKVQMKIRPTRVGY